MRACCNSIGYIIVTMLMCVIFLLIQDMLEQIATCEKVFEVSKANKVLII